MVSFVVWPYWPRSTNTTRILLTLDELYPKHIEALEKAGLPLPTVYPTINEAVEKLKIDIAEKESEEAQSKKMKKARDNNRATYFCIGVSTGFWETPISVTIRELSKKHGLTWLRPKMSYHRFTNLGEMRRLVSVRVRESHDEYLWRRRRRRQRIQLQTWMARDGLVLRKFQKGTMCSRKHIHLLRLTLTMFQEIPIHKLLHAEPTDFPFNSTLNNDYLKLNDVDNPRKPRWDVSQLLMNRNVSWYALTQYKQAWGT